MSKPTPTHLPISMDEPSCPPCHGDCSQSDTCPLRRLSSADSGAPELRAVLLWLTVFWAAVFGLLVAVA